jgi:hypothetical protein
MIINALDKMVQLKLVYYGPALSGKTTSLKSLFNHFSKKGYVLSIESTIGRTLFFDYGTLDFQNNDWKLKIHVFSTTGQDFYIGTRKPVLRNLDGLIFVADSKFSAYERNVIAWDELKTYFGKELIEMPKILSLNKQDLPEKFNPNILLKEIDFHLYRNFYTTKTIAINGEGILESFEKILGLIFKQLYGSQLFIDLNCEN